jgi:hypothetical protein
MSVDHTDPKLDEVGYRACLNLAEREITAALSKTHSRYTVVTLSQDEMHVLLDAINIAESIIEGRPNGHQIDIWHRPWEHYA